MKIKRLLSWLLMCAMLLSMLPGMAITGAAAEKKLSTYSASSLAKLWEIKNKENKKVNVSSNKQTVAAVIWKDAEDANLFYLAVAAAVQHEEKIGAAWDVYQEDQFLKILIGDKEEFNKQPSELGQKNKTILWCITTLTKEKLTSLTQTEDGNYGLDLEGLPEGFELKHATLPGDFVEDEIIGNAITDFTKKCLPEAPDGVDLPEGTTLAKVKDNKVMIPADGSATLLYKLEVTGKPGADFTITDQNAKLVGSTGAVEDVEQGQNNTISGKLTGSGDSVTAAIYVIKSFKANDINGDGKVTNEATIATTTGGGIADGKEQTQKVETLAEKMPAAPVPTKLGNVVNLDCMTNNNHGDAFYPIAPNTESQTDSYVIGEIEQDTNGVWTCTVTVKPVQSYLDRYNQTYSHTYAANQQAQLLTLTWSAKDGWTTEDKVTFNVVCQSTPGTYTITYHGNGGIVSTEGKTKTDVVAVGSRLWESLERVGLPARDGYEFTGWYLDAACKESIEAFAKVAKVNDDVDLYAGWKKIGEEQPSGIGNYTINQHFLEKNGESDKEVGVISVADLWAAAGTPIVDLIGEKAKDTEYCGKVYQYVATETKLNGDTLLAYTAVLKADALSVIDLYYYRDAKLDQRTITYHGNGGIVSTEGETKTDVVAVGSRLWESLERVGLPARDGYEFTGWYLDAACKESIKAFAKVAVVNDDVDLYAGWKKIGEEQPSGIGNYTIKQHFLEKNGESDKEVGVISVADLWAAAGTPIADLIGEKAQDTEYYGKVYQYVATETKLNGDTLRAYTAVLKAGAHSVIDLYYYRDAESAPDPKPDPEPEKPTVGNLDFIKVEVACTNTQATHTPKTKFYTLADGVYKIGEVTWDSSKKQYACEITVYSSAYVAKYNTETYSKHELDVANQEPATFKVYYQGGQWVVSGIEVKFTVKCQQTEPQWVTVTFDSGKHGDFGKKTEKEVRIEKGSYLIAFQIPTVYPDNGYKFVGWYKDGNKSKLYSDADLLKMKFNSSATFTALYKEKGGSGVDVDDEYDVIYNANFTDGGYSRRVGYDEDDKVTVSDNKWFEREGYTFIGWNTKANGNGDSYLPGDTFRMPDSDVYLYAQWQKNKPGPDDTGVSRWLETEDHNAYLTGYPDSTFGADRNMTRAEVAQMFYALLKNKNVMITTSFSDVSNDAWYATAVKTMASLGMMSGYPDGTFRPDEPITRAEFATVALAFAYEPDNARCSYLDVSTSAWYYTYVAQATTYGWIGGYPDGTFRPNNSITRVEVCVIVNNMLGRTPDEDYIDRNEDELVNFVDLSDRYWGYYTIMEAVNDHEYTKDNGLEDWK